MTVDRHWFPHHGHICIGHRELLIALEIAVESPEPLAVDGYYYYYYFF